MNGQAIQAMFSNGWMTKSDPPFFCRPDYAEWFENEKGTGNPVPEKQGEDY